MILSCEEIVFQGEQVMSVQMTNDSDQAMAYKIRVNKLELISVTPCRKVLPSHQTINLQLKIIKQIPFDIKMQISYGPVDKEDDSDFDSLWPSISKDKLKQLIVPVLHRLPQKRANTQRMMNQKEGNISQVSQEESEKLSVLSQKMMKSVKESSCHEAVYISTFQQKSHHTEYLKPNSQKSNKANAQLSEKMQQNARLLARYRNINQIRINQLTNNQNHEEAEPLNILNYTLMAFLLIFIGFFLSSITITKPKV